MKNNHLDDRFLTSRLFHCWKIKNGKGIDKNQRMLLRINIFQLPKDARLKLPQGLCTNQRLSGSHMMRMRTNVMHYGKQSV